ncbi:methyltransferase domain-containing protein [Alteromonas aestuariivivens]|uniref:Methyltransferase domain-containing protein n=1 Tax=Alteromonas aestuariivivens TaxID=1938339 RepID=A0A3D8M3X4_9ALTE|nr:methyltransferase domain-containing protein [Alteromonas aestuariivivens]RDV24255.1 methyltransferase domain-containing protein [Alteromonas aestuariivivens]
MQLARPLTLPESGPKPGAQIAGNFSRFASHYDQYAGIQEQIARKAMLRLASPQGEPVLDLGSGTGRHTHQLFEQGRQVTGADLAEGMVAYARRQYPHIGFVQADAQALPFADGSFAQVFSSMALQWCPQPQQVLRELFRVLPEGGRAVLAIMVAGSFAELDEARKKAGQPASANRHFSHHHWCCLAQQAGFRLRFAECVDHVDEQPDIYQLLASIKRVGAATQLGPNQGASLTRRDLHQLEQAYRSAWPQSQPLPLTYRVCHLTLEK